MGVLFTFVGGFFAAALTFGGAEWACCPDGRTVVLLPPELLSATVLVLCAFALVQFLRDRSRSGLVALGATVFVAAPLALGGALVYLILTVLTAVFGVGPRRLRKSDL